MKKSLIIILVLLSVFFAAVAVLNAQEGPASEPAPEGETVGIPGEAADKEDPEDPKIEKGGEQPAVADPVVTDAPADDQEEEKPEEQPEVTAEPEEDKQEEEKPEEQPEVTAEPDEDKQEEEKPEEQPEVTAEPEEYNQEEEKPEGQPEVTAEPEEDKQEEEKPEEQTEATAEPEEDKQEDEKPEEQPEVTAEPEEDKQEEEKPEGQPEVTGEPEENKQEEEKPEAQPEVPGENDGEVQSGADTPEEMEGMTVHIFGNRVSVEFDGEEHAAEGYRIDVTCGGLEGEDKDACEAYGKDDFRYEGEAVAKGTAPDTYAMGLDPEKFVNENKNFEEVAFVVEEDGRLVISEKSEEPVLPEEPVEGPDEENDDQGEEHGEEGEEPAPAPNNGWSDGTFSNGILTIHLDTAVDDDDVVDEEPAEENTDDEETTDGEENTDDEMTTDDEENTEGEVKTDGEEGTDGEETTDGEENADGEVNTNGEETTDSEGNTDGEMDTDGEDNADSEENFDGEGNTDGEENIDGEMNNEDEENTKVEENTEGEENTDGEENNEEELTALVSAEAFVYAAQDEEGEVLFSADDAVPVVLDRIDGDWALVKMADGTAGYVKLADLILITVTENKETAAEEEPSGEEFEEISSDVNDGDMPEDENEETEGSAEDGENGEEGSGKEAVQALVNAETSIYAAQDEEGEILFTAENEILLVINMIEGDWAQVEMPDGTLGYVKLADLSLISEAENEETETEEGPAHLTAVVKNGIDIRLDADGMSEIIFTLDEDTEVTILAVDGDWVLVLLPDDETQGWIFRTYIELPAEEGTETGSDSEETDENRPAEEAPAPVEKKVTIFTSRRTQMEVGEEIVLTSLLEGFEDCKAIKYQWECDKGDGFEAVEGANSDSYTYAASEESMAWSFRLVVLFK